MIAGALQERTRNDSLDVDNTSIVISPPRNTTPLRRVVVVRNISDDATKIISISFGNEGAIDNNGIVLRQYESFTDSQSGEYLPDQSQINAICAVAGGKIAVFER
jgi:hypothetical protein